MNILVTSAGRRGYIIEYFKKALKGRGKVYAGNSTSFSSAFYYADESVVTPLIYDDNYIPFLLQFCKEKQVEIIISLFDIDLLILAQNKELFRQHGIEVIVSDKAVIEICNDKWKTYDFCVRNHILAPKTYLELSEVKKAIREQKLAFPLIIKPRWGMGSIGIYQVENEVELDILAQKCRREIQSTYLKYEAAVDIDNCIIIQEKLKGEEYGIDIINNLNGQFCGNIVRKKYAMRAGETDCAAVVMNAMVDEFAEKISSALGHIGNLDVDVFVEEEKISLLEMNARFGGGYPFSHLAGVDLPTAIIKWVNGDKVEDELKIREYGKVIQKDIRFVDLTGFHE